MKKSAPLFVQLTRMSGFMGLAFQSRVHPYHGNIRNSKTYTSKAGSRSRRHDACSTRIRNQRTAVHPSESCSSSHHTGPRRC